jgi:NitT/TauT family transport system substrate-binding protein
MRTPQAEGWTRRRFLGGLRVAGTAGLLGLPARPVAAEPPPETTRLRLVRGPGLCVAPEYVAEELLQGEGFHRGAVRRTSFSIAP